MNLSDASDFLRIDVAGDRHLEMVLHGELDIETQALLGAAFSRALINQRPVRVTLDLSDVTFIDAAGVRCLLTCQLAAQGADVRMVLGSPAPVVTRVLQAVRLDGQFVIDDQRTAPAMARSTGTGRPR